MVYALKIGSLFCVLTLAGMAFLMVGCGVKGDPTPYIDTVAREAPTPPASPAKEGK